MARHEIDYDPNICCEICNDCFACDFDCPACGKQTRVWGDICDQIGDKITCEECKTEFIVESAYPCVLVDVE